MGYIFTSEDAERYEKWFHCEPGLSALAVEKELLHRVWSPPHYQRVLEVGCGAGHFLEWFARQRHRVTGLDPSPFMLDLARRKVPQRVHLHQGVAEDLPFANNEFDTVALITTLEFVEDPDKALEEAFRVARNHVLLGVSNKYSLITGYRCLQCLWKSSVYRHARFFSVFGLRCLAEKLLHGHVPIHWRTCLAMPLWTLTYLRRLENSRYFQWHPFGHFIAMRVDVRYNIHTVQEPLLNSVTAQAGSAPHLRAFCRTPQKELWAGNDDKENPDSSSIHLPVSQNPPILSSPPTG